MEEEKKAPGFSSRSSWAARLLLLAAGHLITPWSRRALLGPSSSARAPIHPSKHATASPHVAWHAAALASRSARPEGRGQRQAGSFASLVPFDEAVHTWTSDIETRIASMAAKSPFISGMETNVGQTADDAAHRCSASPDSGTAVGVKSHCSLTCSACGEVTLCVAALP